MLKHWPSANKHPSTTLPPTTTHIKHKPKWPWTVNTKPLVLWNMPCLIFHIFSLSREPAHDRSCCLRVKVNILICRVPAQTRLIHTKSKIINTFYLFVGYAFRMLFQNHTYMYMPTLFTVPGQTRTINYDNWFCWLVRGFKALNCTEGMSSASVKHFHTTPVQVKDHVHVSSWWWSIQNAHTSIGLTNALK